MSADLDDTLYMYRPGKLQPIYDRRSYNLADVVGHLRAEQGIRFTVNTGRRYPWEGFAHLPHGGKYKNTIIPEMDAIIHTSGTEIDVLDPSTGTLQRMMSWVEAIREAVGPETMDQVRALVSAYKNLKLLPEYETAPFKLGIVHEPEPDADYVDIEKALRRDVPPGVLFVPIRKDRVFDFTPEMATKGTALVHYMQSLPQPVDTLITVGDGLNDKELLAPIPGISGDIRHLRIVVGNAAPQLLEVLPTLGIPEKNLFVAPEAAQGPDGLMAGLWHFGMLQPRDLEMISLIKAGREKRLCADRTAAHRQALRQRSA